MSVTFASIELPAAPVELQEKVQGYMDHGYELLVIRQVNFSLSHSEKLTALLCNGQEHVMLDLHDTRYPSEIKAKSFFDHDIEWVLFFSPSLLSKVGDTHFDRRMAI